MRRAWVSPFGRSLFGRPLLVRWALSRAVLLVLALAGQVFGAQQSVLGDVDLYRDWGHTLVAQGQVPGDEKWQYPPGAAVVLALPAVPRELLGVPYEVSFYLLILGLDAVVTWALARRSRRAANWWLLGTLALGPVTVARFDLVPAAGALAAVLALGRDGSGPGPSPSPGGDRDRFGRFGGWVAFGAAVKVWPGLLLVALGRRHAAPARFGWIAAGAAAVAAGLSAVLLTAGWWHGALGFLDAQRARGLQVEAVPATPFVVAAMFGAGSGPTYSYGSLQFDSPAARGVASACSLVEMALIGVAVVWWWGRRPREKEAQTAAAAAAGTAGRALAAVLIIMVTSRVLSPQYLVWLLALAAAQLACTRPVPGGAGEPDGSVSQPDGHPLGRLPGRRGWRRGGLWAGRRDLTVLLVAACLLTQIVYPWRYNDVVQGRVVGGLLLIARNLLLVVAAWYALRATASEPRAAGPAAPPPPARAEPVPPPLPRQVPRLGRAAARLRRAVTTSRHTATPT
ncbi:Protein of unknown function (DUF2029) [Parafrankia irregularis]|uniref:DUF2029 domain-containing protein n=1 Tax=Parafrankia irregularis TaxID=795642 RepID=A0A0S4QRB5_9ACTN|nr:Protein of unknown function (DUF2029) [Parafrankia irregularis]